MNIAIFGCGYVGGTVADWLESHSHNVYRIDPKLYPMTDKDDALLKCTHAVSYTHLTLPTIYSV